MQWRMKDKHATFKKDVGASLGLTAFVLLSKDCCSNSDSPHRKEIIQKGQKLVIEVIKCNYVPGNKAFCAMATGSKCPNLLQNSWIVLCRRAK